MKMHEYPPIEEGGSDAVVLLIHPVLSSAAALKRTVTDRMGNDLRYIVPDLSAHGEAASDEYRSAKEEAGQIADWLIERGCTRITLGFGASLGGVVLFELVKLTEISFECLFFEGVGFHSHAPAIELMFRRAFFSMQRKATANSKLAVRKMEKMYGPEQALPMTERLIAMSGDSIGNIAHDCANVDLPPMDPELQRRCTFAFGKKDPNLSRALRVAPKLYPKATLEVWPGFDHCAKMTGESDTYADLLRKAIGER